MYSLDGYFKEQIDNKRVNDTTYMRNQIENLAINKMEFNKLSKKPLQDGTMLTVQYAKDILGEEEF